MSNLETTVLDGVRSAILEAIKTKFGLKRHDYDKIMARFDERKKELERAKSKLLDFQFDHYSELWSIYPLRVKFLWKLDTSVSYLSYPLKEIEQEMTDNFDQLVADLAEAGISMDGRVLVKYEDFRPWTSLSERSIKRHLEALEKEKKIDRTRLHNGYYYLMELKKYKK